MNKNPIAFSVMWIIIYVVGSSITDSVSESISITKIITLPFHVIIACVILFWLKKDNLFSKYGLCKTKVKAFKYLYYIPLIILSLSNLSFGVSLNLSPIETVLYACSMFLVGFIEEIIFRGFLFEAMRVNGLKSAIIVSSVTFGIGHIVNLFNGNESNIILNLCQIICAIAMGFLFVIIFYRGKVYYLVY